VFWIIKDRPRRRSGDLGGFRQQYRQAFLGVENRTVAILILGLVLRQIPDWLPEFMLVTSLLVLLAGISIAGKHQFGIGAGALERLAQYPESVWLILFGFYISRDHYRNKVAPRGFEFSEKNLYTREMFDERRKKAGEGAR
jgi:hypothetical protein